MVRPRHWLSFLVLVLLGLMLALMVRTNGPSYDGRSAGWWLQELMQVDPDRRARAGKAFSAMGTEAAPFLGSAMARKKTILHKGFDWVRATWSGVAVDGTEEYRWRAAAVHACTALGTNAAILLPDLLHTYYDPELAPHSLGYERAFVEIGPAAIRPMAQAMVDHHSQFTRSDDTLLMAWDKIFEQHGLAESWVPSFQEALLLKLTKPRDGLEAAVACEIAQRCGTRAAPFIVPMIDLTTHSVVLARVASIKALGNLGLEPEKAVGALVLRLEDLHPSVRGAAVQSLGQYGLAARRAWPALARRVDDSSTGVVTTTLNTLAKIGEPASVTAPQIIAAFDHSEPIVRALAARTLALVASEASIILPPLMRALEDDAVEVRRNAAGSLGRLGTRAAPAMEALLGVLDDSREAVQVTVIETLGKIGPAASPAIPRLMLAWNNNQSALGPYVKRAIEDIEGADGR